MDLKITGHQIDVTPALRDYVSDKMDRVARHWDHLHDVHVVLEVEKLEHRAGATLNAARNKTLHVDAAANDMYAAIDLLADKLDRLVIKQKEKMKDHHRGESAARSDSFG